MHALAGEYHSRINPSPRHKHVLLHKELRLWAPGANGLAQCP